MQKNIKRRLVSWIDTFVSNTENLDSPEIFRRWAAITTIGAVVEQKIWLMTSSVLYPNLYTLIVGNPGVGKTRAIRAARRHLEDLNDFHIAPTSLTPASLVDALDSAKRTVVRLPDTSLEYNSMAIIADELGTFVHEYANDMVSLLSSFYDLDPYGQNRRGKDIKVKIKSPQISMLCGSTPSNLMKFIPPGAWDQGFTSRLILIYSTETIVGDDFDGRRAKPNTDLTYDLAIINTLSGDFKVSAEYRNAINAWRAMEECLPDIPKPSHPKLVHYNTRRKVHLYKLSMISAIDHGNSLMLTVADFNRAMGWLVDAESHMSEIFAAGTISADGSAMDEIAHYVTQHPKGLSEDRLYRYVRERVSAMNVMRTVEIMEKSGMITAGIPDRFGVRSFRAGNRKIPELKVVEPTGLD